MKFSKISSVFVWVLALLAICIAGVMAFYRDAMVAPPPFVPLLAFVFAALLAALLAVALSPIFGRLRNIGRVKMLRWISSGALVPLLTIFFSIAAMSESRAAGTNVYQPGQAPRVYSFGGFPSFVSTNATTNVTCGGVPVEPGRGIGIFSALRTAGTENTIEIVSFEVSTNPPGSTVTNWFRPLVPITATFTNNGVATTNNGYALIPPSSVDNVAQIRPFSFRSVAGTNWLTNLTFAAGSTIVP